MKRVLLVLISGFLLLSCSSSGTKVVKPRTHRIWSKGNRYVIDIPIPIGNRHIHMFERKRTKIVRMK